MINKISMKKPLKSKRNILFFVLIIIFFVVGGLIAVQGYLKHKTIENIKLAHQSVSILTNELMKTYPEHKWSDKSSCYKNEPRMFGNGVHYFCDVVFETDFTNLSSEQVKAIAVDSVLATKDLSIVRQFEDSSSGDEQDATIYSYGFLFNNVEIPQGTCILRYVHSGDSLHGKAYCSIEVDEATYNSDGGKFSE